MRARKLAAWGLVGATGIYAAKVMWSGEAAYPATLAAIPVIVTAAGAILLGWHRWRVAQGLVAPLPWAAWLRYAAGQVLAVGCWAAVFRWALHVPPLLTLMPAGLGLAVILWVTFNRLLEKDRS